MAQELRFQATASTRVIQVADGGIEVEVTKERHPMPDGYPAELQTVLSEVVEQVEWDSSKSLQEQAVLVFNLMQQLGGSTLWVRVVKGGQAVTAYLTKD
jgi:hypothetical protein